MFCVIQKIQKKKQDPYGTHKEIIVNKTKFGFVGEEPKTSYGYTYSDERIERPILDAYKISIHHSYRENGKVKKKQWVIRTVSYYDLIEYSLYDCADSSIRKVAKEMDKEEDFLYDLIYEKLNPVIEKIEAEFQQTEEYKVKKKHDKILETHRKVQKAFEDLYGEDTYRYCYDVFGELRNPEYLEKVIADKKIRDEYTRRSYEESYKRNYSNYSGDGSSYHSTSQSNYNDNEKKILHELYRMGSKKFHPDVCGDDGSKMKFLTKLKEQWGL